MSYFRELPDIAYQSPLLHKNSSTDYLIIKNIFRRSKLFDYLKDNVLLFNKFVIGDGDRPDTIAESLYNDAGLDYVIILAAGITNIHDEWPLQDYQVYDYTLEKYGSEIKMNEIHHYETFEIRDEKNRPDYTLLFAWAFKKEIIKKSKLYTENGGKFITPFDKFKG